MAPAALLLFSLSSFWTALLPGMFATAADAQGRETCSPMRCGNLTIASPFEIVPGQEAEPKCSMLGFQVLCRDNIPYLGSYENIYGFQILNIFYGNGSLLISDVYQLQDFNGSDHRVCHAPMFNNSVKLAYPFSMSTVNKNLIFYNCTKAPATEERGSLVETTCQNNTFVRVAERLDDSGNYGAYLLEDCNATVVPVRGGSGKMNASRYEELISDGFLLTWTPTPKPRSKRTSAKIIMIVLLAAAGGLLLPCIYVFIWHRKGQKLRYILSNRTSSSNEKKIEVLISSHGSLAPKRYKYTEITKITCSFNSKLGEGGYGVVFKGTLHDGSLVAVKLLHDSKANGEEFVNEVMSIGRTSHVNVVTLFGFCLEGSKRALIYEYMPNGSLDKYIYSENPKSILGWEQLYAIAVGIARGLEYLHHSCNTRIVHFDIKPQNILLDHKFCPKIADFGLAKLCHTKESKLSMIGARGTIGFIAPEVHSRTFGVVSTKSDVYSYGMMLLEMVGGRKNVKSVVEKSSQKYFPEWIYDHFAKDDGLQACDVTKEVEDIAKKMSLIGLWCVQILPVHRPTIIKVLEMFERGSDELDMPPKQNFSQILKDSAYNLSEDGTSSNSSQTQAYSEMVNIKKMNLANSNILQRLPTL